jgi:hypothetical protein
MNQNICRSPPTIGRSVFLHLPLKRGKDLCLEVGVNPSHSLVVDVISILFPKRVFMDIRYLPSILGENSLGPLQ